MSLDRLRHAIKTAQENRSESLRLNKLLSSKGVPKAKNSLVRREIKDIADKAISAYKKRLRPIPGHGQFKGKTIGATYRGTF